MVEVKKIFVMGNRRLCKIYFSKIKESKNFFFIRNSTKRNSGSSFFLEYFAIFVQSRKMNFSREFSWWEFSSNFFDFENENYVSHKIIKKVVPRYKKWCPTFLGQQGAMIF